MKLLIVEDEAPLNKSMVEYLSSQKYRCESVMTYGDALEKIESHQYDCIVLDIMLPGGSGIKLLQQLRETEKEVGVIIISARDQMDDKITGLQLGADDYQTKPFHMAELSSRIAAIIRRKNLSGSNMIRFEEIQIDVNAKQVTVNDDALTLTRKEYDLLLYFIINKNRVLSKSAIAEHLWGDNMYLVDNYDFMYAHIKNLRKKLVKAGAGDYIRSLYGMGYKISVK
ncbi:response regulator transcription factor [Taibaiella soli]|uniref:DNA-binding response regulator n=1 Tax=Taibaiella soli TaxID=1649169 RepID=A0A2W2ADN0_9BACT|nr:response regulator transcription factor [Taibaiella soli]PZF73371.1 DNA-binding response regulator [Taibaiella soli]